MLKHPRVTRSARDEWGNQISLGGSVDLGLLNQSLRNQQVLLARERNRAKMELGETMELGDGIGSQLGEEDTPYIVEEQIQPLSTNSACAARYYRT